MGKSTISMAIFNSKLLVYQRVDQIIKTKNAHGIFLASPDAHYRYLVLPPMFGA